MFKPTLKRSKATSILVNSRATAHTSSFTTINDKATLMQKVQNPGLYIPPLFTKTSGQSAISKEGRILCPLSFWDIEYPFEVKQKLNLPIQKVKSRLVGTKYGIFWLVTQNQLHLWRYDSIQNPSALSMHRKFQFQQNIRAVCIGHLNKHDCQFFTFPENCETLAIGFESMVDLYTVNLLTLQIRSIQVRIKVQFNQSLQMLEITKQNQLLFTGAQGFLTRVSFNGFDCFGFPKVHKSIGRPNTLSKTFSWSNISLSKTKTKIYTQKILRSDAGKLYVLLRKQSEGSLLYRLGLKIKRFLRGKIQNDESSLFIEKEICIYKINEKNNSIRFESKITNEQINKKIKDSFSANQIKYTLEDQVEVQEEVNNIVTIFVDKSNTGIKVATSSGLFLSLRENPEGTYNHNSFSFTQGPQLLPQQLYIRSKTKDSNAIVMRNSEQVTSERLQDSQPLVEKSNKLIFSLGNNSLNLMSNGLGFCFKANQIQIIKLQKQPGLITEAVHRSSEQALSNSLGWFIFSKSQILFIKKVQVYEHIVTALDSALQLNAQSTNNEQKIQFKQQAYSLLKQIHQVLGHGQICRQLLKVLLFMSRNTINQQGTLSTKIEPGVVTSSEMKECTKQEQRLRARIEARLKYQNTLEDTVSNAFNRWLIPKSKMIRPYLVKIGPEVKLALWRYFLVQEVEKTQISQFLQAQTQIVSPQQKLWISLPLFPKLLISTFQQYYESVKQLRLTEIRKSPAKIKEIKSKLNSFLHFLQEKRQKSHTILNNLISTNFQPITQDPSSDQKLQKQSTQDKMKNTNTLDTTFYETVPYNPPNVLVSDRNLNMSSASQEIENELMKIIPKITSLLELYQILSANSQRKYQDLPTIQKFFTSFDAKQKIKSALIDLFSTSDFSIQDIVLRFNKSLPELWLQSDIYLSKWIKFVTRGQSSREFDDKISINSQIRSSDLLQLSKKIDIGQVIKIKSLFKEVQSYYVKLLMEQLQWRKIQMKIADQVISKQKKRLEEAQNGITTNNTMGISIFQWDKHNSQQQWRGWLLSEIIMIKNQINSYLQDVSISMHYSSASEYLEKERAFDECTKMTLQYRQEGVAFIKQLIEFLNGRKIMAEKVYRLAMTISPNTKTFSSNLLQERKRPELMNSFALINKYLMSNKEESFGQLNSTSEIEKAQSNKNKDNLLI